MQDHVVQGRRTVLSHQTRDVAEGVAGDPYRQSLVDPQMRVYAAQSQPQRDADHDRQRGRNREPRDVSVDVA